MNENIKKRFEVHKLEGKGTRRIATPKIALDDKGKPELNDKGKVTLLGGFEYKDMEVDAGWMVYFPNGSSIHIWTKDEMERQGFLLPTEYIDMNTGDTVPMPSNMSLKDRSEQKERVTKSTKVHHVNN